MNRVSKRDAWSALGDFIRKTRRKSVPRNQGLASADVDDFIRCPQLDRATQQRRARSLVCLKSETPKPEIRNPNPRIAHQAIAPTLPFVFEFRVWAFLRFSDFGLGFVLPKLHAKWLQLFVARNVFLDFLWAYSGAARPHIYKHLRKQEHWHCGTRRPRVSRNCDFGRWRSFASFWFWLCQVRISPSLSACLRVVPPVTSAPSNAIG